MSAIDIVMVASAVVLVVGMVIVLFAAAFAGPIKKGRDG